MAQVKDTDDFWDEYDYDNNPPIDEVNVRKDNVRWICRKDPRHVWDAKITNRRAGQGCAVCAGKKVIAGVNDFASQLPDAAAQWDYDKNSMSPSEVTPYSNKKVTWKCELGHTWEATVANRASGHGCPYCAGKKVWAGFNDLATENPELAEEWSDRNEFSPTEVTSHSNKKIWWKCPECGYEYQATPNARSGSDSKKATGCPCCANRVIVMGVNDLATTDPELAKEYVYEKNPSLDKVKFHEKVWWRCKEGHPAYEQSIDDRKHGHGCPVCGNVKLVSGINDLATMSPELLLDWDYEHNEISPSEVFAFSNKKAYWKCHVCGHEWEKTIGQRQLRGCPACAGQVLIKGRNDLKSQRPDLLEEWDYERNTISPDEVFVSSNVDIHWICKQGHRYTMKLDGKSRGNHGCPICVNQKIVPGINDLATLRPDLLEEWDYDRNDKRPEEVGAGSKYQAYWICKNNPEHKWRAQVCSRNIGTGCPHCVKGRQSSKPEQAVYICIHNIASDAINRYKFNNNMEIDIFIPSLNVGIEYDGRFYHTDVERDLTKDALCEEMGITLYRIREPETPTLDSTSIVVQREDVKLGKDLDKVIELLIKSIFGIDAKINTQSMACEILANLCDSKHPKALSEYHPVLAAQWDYDKNSPLLPDRVGYSSTEKFWWVCPKCGHAWQATPRNRSRVKKSYGQCPECGHVPDPLVCQDRMTINSID